MDLASEILSDTIAYMKYAKWLPGELRKETWEEVCHRNMNMHINKYAKNENLVEEIRDVYNNFVIPKKVLPSMRSMQYAGKSIELDQIEYTTVHICLLMIWHVFMKPCSCY